MDLPSDFRNILFEMLDADVEFVAVGGYAVAFHGHARATKDIDILVRAHHENAKRVYRALAAFGAPLQAFDVSESDCSSYDGVPQIGSPPLRIDVINKVSGISFDEAVEEKHAV